MNLADNRFKDVHFGLCQAHARYGMILDVLLSNLHDCCTHLKIEFHDFDENLDRDLLLNRWTDQFEELFLSVLLVLCALRRDVEHSNLSLRVILQL